MTWIAPSFNCKYPSMLVHQQLIQTGCESDVFVGSSLVDMYVKCGSIEDARRVFNNMPSRNVVTWSAMIFGHVKCGQGQKALELFPQMQHEGVQPNSVTFVGVLNACASIIALNKGRCVHLQIIQSGLESNVFVGNSLIDMYAKCGSLEDACRVFNKMPSRNVVTWNAMILGHVKCGQGQKALKLFQQMQQEDVFVGSSLVDMYAKCGSIEDACRVFHKMPSRNVVTWTAMVLGHVKCGHEQKALELFQQMQQEACSHASLVDEGMCLYASMIRDYMIPAKLEHYTCMVDLLGRAGHLQEAENMIMAMPCKPQAATWRALLGACRIHGNVGLAERVAKQILEMEPENAAVYVLLSNIYAAAGNRHLCENVGRQRKERGAKKQPGRTWIEVNNEVHTFVAQDQDHPQMIEIHAELQRLSGLMHNAGYVPCTEFVLDDVEEEEKVSHLCHHSEKLAIAFGLINTAPDGVCSCMDYW
ncbi:unnamed protein product [Sphagnum troendelagicum]|uniref:DYW domain-containing protein n=1 Tax=Sphagnum troendelagicum TaxID=128251 RepID=A0ABP0UGN3_9BRYO